MPKVLGVILAGGRGTRLEPLTRDRAKPAVPFGAKWRIIDFVLNNFINSGIYSIYVLTQFKAQSLTEHIQRHWRFGGMLQEYFIMLVPAQMRRFEELGPHWFRGTADAVYQSMHLIAETRCDYVVVFGGDHIYKMDVAQMVALHEERGADISVAAFPMPVKDCTRFGVIQVDEEWWIRGWQEKPADPEPIPGSPSEGLASMGNYVFRKEVLLELLDEDARKVDSSHDFGKDVIPGAIDRYKILAYDFRRNALPGTGGAPNTYWRDVGTLDSYWEANMDLTFVIPAFDLFNQEWPLRSANTNLPPAKFVHDSPDRTGRALNSVVAGGTIVSGATLRESVVASGVRIHSYAEVYRSVILDGVEIGRHCRIQNAIIDKNVQVPPGEMIGYDLDKDRERFTVTPKGLVAVPKEYVFP